MIVSFQLLHQLHLHNPFSLNTGQAIEVQLTGRLDRVDHGLPPGGGHEDDDRVPAEDSLLDEPAKGLAEGGPVDGDGEIEGGHGEGGADAGEQGTPDRSAGIPRRCGRRYRSGDTRTGARGIHR